jgi:hypothetical protein
MGSSSARLIGKTWTVYGFQVSAMIDDTYRDHKMATADDDPLESCNSARICRRGNRATA